MKNIWIPCLGYHHINCHSHFNFLYPRMWLVYFIHFWNFHIVKKYHKESYVARRDWIKF